MCVSNKWAPVNAVFKGKLETVINAVTDGSEFLWKQKTEMIMAGHRKIKKKSSQ